MMKLLLFSVFVFMLTSQVQAQANEAPKMKQADSSSAGDTLLFAEVSPEFPGGEMEMHKFIYKEFAYPETPDKSLYSCRVVVRFAISAEGNVENVHIKKSAGRDVDQLVMELIQKMPRWTPGQQDGKPVAVWLTLPILICLK